MQLNDQTVWPHKCFFFAFHFKFYLLLLFVILTINFAKSNASTTYKCKPNYLNYNENHTACKSVENNCTALKSGISTSDIALIIATHNKLRNDIASGNQTSKGFPSSANMLVLEWDEELALIAQAHASQCHFEHDCYSCRRTDKFEIVGQNLFLYRTSRPTFKPRWHEVIQMWYDELNIAPKNIVQHFHSTGLNIGHFTQMVWANTGKIGCGFVAHAVFNSVYKVAHLYTCNYAPGGNYIGLQLYEIGRPASRCPRNAKPSFHYKALCKAYKKVEIKEEKRLISKKKVHLQHHKHNNTFQTESKKIIVNKVTKRRRYYSRYNFKLQRSKKIDRNN